MMIRLIIGSTTLVLLGAAVGALVSGCRSGNEVMLRGEAVESAQFADVVVSSGGYRPNKPFALKENPKGVKAAIKAIRDHRMQESTNMTDVKATFLQIGANDGQRNDQLYPEMKDEKNHWIGLMVEPQPIRYSKLALLHADVANEWSFYQGVVVGSCTEKGYVSFCETNTPGEGNYRTQRRISGVCDPETTVQVDRPCVKSFKDLLDRGSPAFHQKTTQPNGMHYVDLLAIDAEGKDDEVIAMLDSNVIMATCLIFEHKHIKRKDEADGTDHFKQTRRKLEEMGFNSYSKSSEVSLVCRVAEGAARAQA